jgi:tetratricopeptide (TPR) repeat protein
VKHDCDYHPGDPAKWHCGECQIHFCSRCMPDADQRKQHALCPKCNRAMRYLGAATEVVPFWNRIGAFFRYPFHTDPLLVIAICTLVPLVITGNIVGLIVSLVLVLALLKYTYAVIRHTADGHMKPPPVSVAFSGTGFDIVILQLLVFILMGALVSAAMMVGGPVLMLVALALVVLALPASVMVLAMEHSVAAAVNPMNLAVLISRIGSPYFLLYGYLILLSIASGAAQEFAFNHFAPQVANILAGFLNSTFTLMLFHMLGYLLFQYQEELGFASDHQDEESLGELQSRDRTHRFDADIDMNLKDGNYDRVQSMLKDSLKRDPSNAHRLEQLHALLTARDDHQELYRYHPRLLTMLADKNDGESLASLLSTIEQTEPGFRLNDPELALHCARTLYHRGQFKPVLKLLQDFHKRFPESECLPHAYLVVAQALANGLGQWEKATAFLTFIKKRCVNHPLHEQIDVYLQQAQNHEPLKGPKASFSVE